ADLEERASGVGEHVGRDVAVEAERAEEAGEDGVEGGELAVDVVGAGGLEEADVPAEGGQVGLSEAAAEHADVAAGGEEVAGEDAGEGGLARVVGPEDGGAGAGGDGPINVAEDPSAGAQHADVAQVERGR